MYFIFQIDLFPIVLINEGRREDLHVKSASLFISYVCMLDFTGCSSKLAGTIQHRFYRLTSFLLIAQLETQTANKRHMNIVNILCKIFQQVQMQTKQNRFQRKANCRQCQLETWTMLHRKLLLVQHRNTDLCILLNFVNPIKGNYFSCLKGYATLNIFPMIFFFSFLISSIVKLITLKPTCRFKSAF